MKDERFAQFVMRLKQQSADCGFDKYSTEISKILTEITLIDVIVQGCTSNELRRRILKEDHSLAEIEALGAMFECVDEQVKSLSNVTANTQEKIFKVTESKKVEDKPDTNGQLSCYRCGNTGHFSKSPNCPARNKTCRRCKRIGHFESVCRGFSKRPAQKLNDNITAKKVRAIETVDSETELMLPGKDSKKDEQTPSKTYYAFYTGNETNMIECHIGGIKWKVIIDSGSECNLITKNAWEKMKTCNIAVQSSTKGCDRVLKAYGSNVPLKVNFKIRIRYDCTISIINTFMFYIGCWFIHG